MRILSLLSPLFSHYFHFRLQMYSHSHSAFYLLQQLSGHLAGILGLNPALLILTPPFLLLAIAIAAIRHRNL